MSQCRNRFVYIPTHGACSGYRSRLNTRRFCPACAGMRMGRRRSGNSLLASQRENCNTAVIGQVRGIVIKHYACKPWMRIGDCYYRIPGSCAGISGVLNGNSVCYLYFFRIAVAAGPSPNLCFQLCNGF